MSSVRVAIVGVGNCASSLVQGVEFYRDAKAGDDVPGLMHVQFGDYHVSDIEFVAAFDVDDKKVGKDLSEAINASENCTIKIEDVPTLGIEVQRGPTLDGIGKYYAETIDEAARRELNEETGATAFDLHPIALYSVEQSGEEVFGALYFAEVYRTEPLDPASEIGEIRRTSVFPTRWTYPEIQPRLLQRVQEWLNLQTGADELWDLLDEDGNPTGKTHRRGDPLAPGERHLSVSVWMRNSRGEFLLTQRAANKGYPHLWECTGGAAVAGDAGR